MASGKPTYPLCALIFSSVKWEHSNSTERLEVSPFTVLSTNLTHSKDSIKMDCCSSQLPCAPVVLIASSLDMKDKAGGGGAVQQAEGEMGGVHRMVTEF